VSARQRYGGSGEDVAGTVRRLALRWEVVPQPVIGGTVEHPLRVDLALLHPARGVALLDLAPRATAHAVASLRRSLDAAGVQARHPGLLPIVYCCLAPEEVPVLPRLLDAAFATQRPLAMADPGWPATVRGVLAGGGPGRAAEAPVGPAVGRRTRPGRLARIGAALVLPLAAVGALAVGIARLPPPPPRETPADAPWPPREMGADASPRTGPTVEQARVSPDAEPVRGSAPPPAPQPEGAGADAPPQPTLGTHAAAVFDGAEEAPPAAPEGAFAAEPPPAPERADFGPQEAPGPGGAPLEDVAGRASGPSAPPDDLPSPPTSEGAAPWAAAAAGPAPEGAAAQPFARSGGEEPAPPPDAAAGPFAGGDAAARPVPRQVPVPPPPAPSVAAGLAAVPPEASIPGGSAEPRADAPAEAAVPEAEETASSAAPPPEAVPIGVGRPDPPMPGGAEALRGGVADLPPADPIGPRRIDTGGRGEAPRGPLAALPPPPPAVPAPDRPGERTPSSARSSAAPPSRGAAVEPPAPRQPASPRCAAILARLQLGETPSHADRLHLQTICAPRP
jgi:hypothetical protein